MSTRNYTHISTFKEEIIEMKRNNATLREIADKFGFKDKYVVKEFLKRERRNQRKQECGILPKRRGRPPKGYVSTEQEKDNEIKRLKMENELLRDFLYRGGRRCGHQSNTK